MSSTLQSSSATPEPHQPDSTATINTPGVAHNEPAGQQHDQSTSPAQPRQASMTSDLMQDPRALQNLLESISVCQPGTPRLHVVGGLRCSACSGPHIHLIPLLEFGKLRADLDYKMQVTLVDADSELLGEAPPVYQCTWGCV
ncbi:hypothetical protein LTR17_012485 [Elasticomyces elasticus]|nr:hypothetical protein LTR17_012485 [Elasticomyces elasticus]